jgi:hypothetical protein
MIWPLVVRENGGRRNDRPTAWLQDTVKIINQALRFRYVFKKSGAQDNVIALIRNF